MIIPTGEMHGEEQREAFGDVELLIPFSVILVSPVLIQFFVIFNFSNDSSTEGRSKLVLRVLYKLGE